MKHVYYFQLNDTNAVACREEKYMKIYELGNVRTNNFSENVGEKITKLWTDAQSKIITKEVYGVYHSYESDYKGDYTLSICTEKNESDGQCFDLETNQYVIYHIPSAHPEAIFETWKQIWSDEMHGTLKRAYTFDYEQYKEDGTVDIYISLEEL